MTNYLVDVAWNHKGARYEKRSHERVSASSAGAAISNAISKTRKKHRGSVREVPGARFYFTVTVIGGGEA